MRLRLVRLIACGRALQAFLLQLIWPARCAGCDTILAGDGVVFCPPCALGLAPIGPACDRCALPAVGMGGVPCPDCARTTFSFTRAVAAFEYGEAIAAAIVRMKHGDRPDLARRLGRLFATTVVHALQPTEGVGVEAGRGGVAIDAVVPVPLHARKLRRRGFNQALHLAQAALRGMGGRGPAIERRLLRRIKDTRELGHAGPAARRREVAGAFAVAKGGAARVRGRRFLIIDDVMTTGATLDGCAAALLAAGAAEVRVAALARAPA